MLARLLPRSSAPISRSLSSVSRSASAAPVSPRSAMRVQLAAAGGGERGLRPGEERREHEQQHDPDPRSPESPEVAGPLGQGGPSWSSVQVAWCRVHAVRRRVRLQGRRRVGERMLLQHQLAQPGLEHVGVDLGGGDAGVAEQGLDHAEVGAVGEEVGGEGVAEGVGRDRGRRRARRGAARSLTSRKKRSRVMWPRRPRAGKR